MPDSPENDVVGIDSYSTTRSTKQSAKCNHYNWQTHPDMLINPEWRRHLDTLISNCQIWNRVPKPMAYSELNPSAFVV